MINWKSAARKGTAKMRRSYANIRSVSNVNTAERTRLLEYY